jgi:hypothetical protein
MAKTFTKDEVADKVDEALAKGEEKGRKAGTKHAVDQLKAEIGRVKQSDLGKAEQKAAINALKAAAAAVKSPFGA